MLLYWTSIHDKIQPIPVPRVYVSYGNLPVLEYSTKFAHDITLIHHGQIFPSFDEDQVQTC